MKQGTDGIAGWLAGVALASGLLLGSVLGADKAPTGSYREQFAEANRLYAAQDYEKAAALYGSLAEQGISREVQFNLGNCYFRLGQTGRASLAYRRALLADPGMIEASQNLRFLQSKLGSLTFETRGLQRAVGRLSVRQWFWITAVGAWVLILGVTGRTVFRLRQSAGGMVMAIAVCGGMVCAAGGWAVHVLLEKLSPNRLAIVVEDGAVALTGPFPDAKAVRSVSPGSEVRIEAVRDEWVFVYLPGDSAGWLERRAIEELLPSQS